MCRIGVITDDLRDESEETDSHSSYNIGPGYI